MKRTQERWSPIEGWPTYFISTLGRVKRCGFWSKDGKYVRERMLKMRRSKKGYLRVCLNDGTRRQSPVLHSLVPKEWPNGIPVLRKEIPPPKKTVPPDDAKLIPLHVAASRYGYRIKTLTGYKSTGVIDNPLRGYVYEQQVRELRSPKVKRSIVPKENAPPASPPPDPRLVVEATPYGHIVRDTRKPTFP